ncbi:hypothetical protein XELAEV_18016029mg [Xenopus laevis]|uniref:Secreted protein n=1 Tax=Xenopus laevis TaxID=8355 RepID=A0A974DJT0_XENLA|nr:hypothetical protein XELAEV_18016029mg [Xenopus laevis]
MLCIFVLICFLTTKGVMGCNATLIGRKSLNFEQWCHHVSNIRKTPEHTLAKSQILGRTTIVILLPWSIILCNSHC